MDLLGFDPKDLARSAGNASKQLRRIMSVQPIQRASQAVIVEHLGVIPAPNRCSIGLLAKYCGTKYN